MLAMAIARLAYNVKPLKNKKTRYFFRFKERKRSTGLQPKAEMFQHFGIFLLIP
jgi:hypothetical protein